MNRADFLNGLVSRPWTPDDHCWAFVCEVRKALFGCEALPPFGADLVDDIPARTRAFATHPARADWHEVQSPQDGDVAIMTKAHALHAGIWLVVAGRGLVWHSDDPHGVVAETLAEIGLRRWTIRFFRYRS